MNVNLKLRDIKKDQTFYECEQGMNIKMVALEDAHESVWLGTRGTVCAVRTESGDEFEMFEALNPYGYALKLYSMPVYGKNI